MSLKRPASSTQYLKRTSGLSAREASLSETSWTPNTDMYVTSSGLVIKVELAGMRREDLELTIEGNRLRIAGQRPDGCRSGACKFLLMEISYGGFESVIEVPPGFDLAQARAAYQNGFLRVDVPSAADSIDPATGADFGCREG
jgi:HSP20 family protein